MASRSSLRRYYSPSTSIQCLLYESLLLYELSFSYGSSRALRVIYVWSEARLFHPGRIITLLAEASKRKQEQLCESFVPAAPAGHVTCVGIPLREQPYGSLFYEVFLSENNHTVACSTRCYSSSLSSTVLALRVICSGPRCWPSHLRGCSSPRTTRR